jgi:hypothetical protein
VGGTVRARRFCRIRPCAVWTLSNRPGRGAWLCLVALLVSTAGCRTHLSLRDNTIRTTSTLADLNYQQVLDNLARFQDNPAAMPSIAVVNAGTVNVADQQSFNANATYAPTLTFGQQIGSGLPILSLLLNPSGTRNVTENWSLAPVTDIDNLRRIRCAYQLLVSDGAPPANCIPCRELIKRFYLGEQDDLDCVIPKGWYSVGCKKDVPPNACYVGHYCNTYVWVTADGLDGLTRFTMTVIDLATGKPHAPTKSVVQTYGPDGKLQNTQVTTTEIDTEALKEMRKEAGQTDRARQYLSPPLVNPGMFFVPH